MSDVALTAKAALQVLQSASRPDRITSTERFFKAYPGGYSEGDVFLAVGVPQTRLLARSFRDLPLHEVSLLMQSKWHDARLMALIILVERYKRAAVVEQEAIYNFYMEHIARVNNWDLVDSSAEYVVGPWLDGRPEQMEVLQRLAASGLLWERRIAMLATFNYIKQGRADEALVIAGQLLHDEHDLIQKAVGWMLREIGKRVDRSLLVTFLDRHAATMPRTSLRYAIEHFNPERRAHYRGLA
jgi:3-methyladenine DNA glycosylase AlkD